MSVNKGQAAQSALKIVILAKGYFTPVFNMEPGPNLEKLIKRSCNLEPIWSFCLLFLGLFTACSLPLLYTNNKGVDSTETGRTIL